MMMLKKKCPTCGHLNDPDNMLCDNCGAFLTPDALISIDEDVFLLLRTYHRIYLIQLVNRKILPEQCLERVSSQTFTDDVRLVVLCTPIMYKPVNVVLPWLLVR